MFDKQVILYALPTEECSFSLIAGERNSRIRSLHFYSIICYLGLSQESKATYNQVRQRKKIFRETSSNNVKCEVHIEGNKRHFFLGFDATFCLNLDRK